MKNVISIFIILYFLLFPVKGQSTHPVPNWRIISSKYPTQNTVIAGYTVTEFGAKGDGITDDTRAFRQALNAMHYYGGGIVFVPEGKYVISEPIEIQENISLRGEWKAPDQEGIHGTVLMVKTGKGDEDGQPFITLNPSTGVKELNIWYPEQNADKIVEYPWCIHQLHKESATVENVTLVNPYLGIKIGPKANSLHYIHNVYGTPLKTGLQFDRCFDIGRLENISFNPDIWSNSHLPGAPDRQEILSYTLDKGTGMIMYRSDWEYGYNCKVEGYKIGFEISGSPQIDIESGAPEAYPNAQFYGFEFKNCQKAVFVKGANPYGIAFTKSDFQGNDIGFEAAKSFNSIIQFHDCQFLGRKSLVNNGNGHFALQHCSINGGEINLLDGSAAVLDSKISGNVVHFYLDPQVQKAELLGNKIDPGCKLIYDKHNDQITIDSSPYSFYQLPVFQSGNERVVKAKKEKLYIVTQEPYSADGFGEKDCYSAIQTAIDDAYANGGGIVFFPAGIYRVKNNLILKEGVELRGISEVPHHTESLGSILFIETGKGKDEKATPFIRMKQNSGIQGMTFHYPGQNYKYLSSFPFMIRGEGENIYLVNISASNPYRMLDLSSYTCDRHYLSYVTGAPLSIGLKIGKGSKGGYVKNIQFNPHYWGFTKFDNAPKYPAYMEYIWEFQKKNLDAVILGDVQDQVMFQNFVFGSLYGIHLIEEKGKGPSGYIHGHGSDGAEIAAYVQGVGQDGINFVNTQLVTVLANQQVYIHFNPGSNKSLGFYNTLLWGTPVESAILESGKLIVQLANFQKSGRFGFDVKGGDLYLVNTYFWKPLRFIRVESINSPPVLLANIYRNKKRDFPLNLEIKETPHKPPIPDVFLSETDYIKAVDRLFDEPKFNKSIRDNPLQVDGISYEKGIGVHADSELIYALKPSYDRFVATVGLDDEILAYKNYQKTMVIYQVWIDNQLMAESPEIMMDYNRIWHFDVPIPENSDLIKLKVIGFEEADHADWVNAGFITK